MRLFAWRSFPRGHPFKLCKQRNFARAGSNGCEAPLLFAGHLHARHLAAGHLHARLHHVGLVCHLVVVMVVMLDPVVRLSGQDCEE